MGTGISKKYGRVTFFVSVAIFAALFFVNNSYGSMQISQVTPPTLTPPTCSNMTMYKELAVDPIMKAAAPFMKSTCDQCKSAIEQQKGAVSSAMAGAQSADAAVAGSTAAGSGAAAAGAGAAQASTQFANGTNQCGGGNGLTDQAGIADKLSNQLNSCASAIDSACGGGMAPEDSDAGKAAANSCRSSAAQAKAVSSSKVADASQMASKCGESNQNGEGLDKLAQAAGPAAQAAAGAQPQPKIPKPTPTTPTMGDVNKTDLGKNNIEASKVGVNTFDNLGATSGFEARTGNSPLSGHSSLSSNTSEGSGAAGFGAGAGATTGSGSVSSSGGSSAGTGGSTGADSKNAAANTGAGKPGDEGGSTYGSGGGGYSGSKPVLGLSVDSNDLVKTFGVAAGNVLGGLSDNLGRDPSSKGDSEDDDVKQSLFIRVNLKINKMAKIQNFLVAAPSKD